MVLLVVAFGALVLWLRYVALPNVDGFRQDIVASIERSTGMALKVRSLAGGWGGLRPRVTLEGLEISDRGGRAAFQLERAEVTLSWWTLFAGQLRFHDVDFHRPDLVLRRGADGIIYLADKPLNEAGPDSNGAFIEWLLAQPRVGIHNATLTWRDDFGGAPEVKLTGVEIAVQQRLGHHRASLVGSPPPELAARIDLRADVVLSREGTQWRARGDAYAESLNANLARLREHLPVPETLRSGIGSLRLWVRFSPHQLDEVVADLHMRDARAQLAADALALELATLSGRATYRVQPSGFTFATEGLEFRLASGVEVQRGDFSVARTEQAGTPALTQVRADNIDIKIAATLLDYFPLPRENKSQVLRFAPRGRISQALVSWTGDGAKKYTVKGRFEDLAVNAVDNAPGVSGISGSVDGTEKGGTVILASRNATFELSHMFRAPLAFATADGRARWRHEDRVLAVDLDELSLANTEMAVRFAGTWHSLPDARVKSPGYLDLKGVFTRGNTARTADYLPNKIAVTRDWLERSLQSGELTRGRIEFKGDIYEFPFGAPSTGYFLFEGDVRNARLRYHPNWPSVDGIEGTFRFENRRMEILSANAAIFGSRVRTASAVVEDLAEKPPVLAFNMDVETTGADTTRFLRESPLATGPGAFTRVVAIEGPARLKLRLDYPFYGTDPLKVQGEFNFAGATATSGRTLAMRDITGRLAFSEKSLRAPELAGTMFGKPAVLSLASDGEGRVITTIDGAIDVPVLGAYLPEAITARLDGGMAWKARVVSNAQGTDVTISSDLRGMASTLPVPAAKTAQEARALTIRIDRPGQDTELANATLEGGLYWRSSRYAPGGADRWQVALRMGAPITSEPARDGLWLYGAAPLLDADAWFGVFTQPRLATAMVGAPPAPAEQGGLELRGIDMRIGKARYLSRDFVDVAARLVRDGPRWEGELESPLVAGTLQWYPEGKGRLVARLNRLSVPESKALPGTVAPERAEADLPAIDVQAEKFDFRGYYLGRLDMQAQNVGDEWRINKLDIDNNHAHFRSSGGWRRTGAGSITSLSIALDADNLNALMSQFGWGDYMKRGSGKLAGTLAWPGLPHEFSTSILSGGFKVEAKRGQFAKFEPGAGKLLGLLSLQSLPRRAMFDFRDVFSDGFAFETIEGDVKVARGILVTDSFEITGPSAFASLSGEVSLPLETQRLTLRVVPEVGEGMALAATLLGTPVLGLSTLLVSKLLRNPFGKAVAYEYQVTGSWDNPSVMRLSAPPAPPAKANVAAEAQK